MPPKYNIKGTKAGNVGHSKVLCWDFSLAKRCRDQRLKSRSKGIYFATEFVEGNSRWIGQLGRQAGRQIGPWTEWEELRYTNGAESKTERRWSKQSTNMRQKLIKGKTNWAIQKIYISWCLKDAKDKSLHCWYNYHTWQNSRDETRIK